MPVIEDALFWPQAHFQYNGMWLEVGGGGRLETMANTWTNEVIQGNFLAYVAFVVTPKVKFFCLFVCFC